MLQIAGQALKQGTAPSLALSPMVGQTTYVPPPYVPLGQSDAEADPVSPADAIAAQLHNNNGSGQWSSGICACFDDMQSCTLLSAL